jgi:hypothetical protein
LLIRAFTRTLAVIHMAAVFKARYRVKSEIGTGDSHFRHNNRFLVPVEHVV